MGTLKTRTCSFGWGEICGSAKDDTGVIGFVLEKTLREGADKTCIGVLMETLRGCLQDMYRFSD